MNLKIHKKDGLVEIFTKSTRILIDQGKNLDENEVILRSNLESEYEFESVNAMFHSGYKTDYMVMTQGFLTGVPIYSGKLSSEISAASGMYKAKKPVEFAGFYEDGKAILVGDMTITPYLVDDQQHNGYMLMIESSGKIVCYSGDFGANGRTDFYDAVAKVTKKVDILMCGDSMIADYDTNLITEGDVQAQATKIMAETEGAVFIMQSVTDFDRANTMFFAARNNKISYVEDLYMATIATGAVVMPCPSLFVKAYLRNGYGEDHFRYQLFKNMDRILLSDIYNQKVAINIQPSMKKFVKSLSLKMNLKNSMIINALPEESIASEKTMEFLQFAKTKGLNSVTLRTSGHAGAKALQVLITKTNPKKIVPISDKNLRWLRREHPTTLVLSEDEIYC